MRSSRAPRVPHAADGAPHKTGIALVNVAGSALVTGREALRHGNSHATIEPYRAFEASDGGFLLAVGTDRQFEALCEKVLGQEDIARDARFSTNAARVVNRKELVPILASLFAKEPRATWLERCKSAGIPAGPVAGVLEAIRSPQATALGSVLETTRNGRTVPTIRPPFFLDGFADPAPAAPPRLGEDTRGSSPRSDSLRLPDRFDSPHRGTAASPGSLTTSMARFFLRRSFSVST